ncbi:helix-turn-helix domain-containing protein [Jiella marina]|uniref:helix-turn-helix domain-containing protein n=1 Tax=Jiella sp. LLJ827 TaxID=2917712 RepID=UPI002101963A|nr:helix-turn-helix transcriptional regulator [Jiella sp. LLJ827]MCQ0986787.1 helix-turn-helix transcriptional regulator [Jiella sp. LLJ827]
MNEAVNLKGEAMIVMTRAEYDALIEDIGDIALAEEARMNSQGAPAMPSELVLTSLNGELHPLAAWRKSVGLTQAELAAKAGVRAASVSDIESRKIDPRLSTLKALAAALNLGIEDIID